MAPSRYNKEITEKKKPWRRHSSQGYKRTYGVEVLQMLLEQRRKGLSAAEVGSNSWAFDGVCQGGLQALASASALAGEHLKVHFNVRLAIVECLGDAKQPVRDAANRPLLALMEISIIVERAAWTHRNWRVREEFAKFICLLFSDLFCRQLCSSLVIKTPASGRPPCNALRKCIGTEFHSLPLPPSQMAELVTLRKWTSRHESLSRQSGATETIRKSSPRGKPAPLEVPSFPGDDSLEQPVDPIKVYSERELMEKILPHLRRTKIGP